MQNRVLVLPTASAAELGTLPGPTTVTTHPATSPPVDTISGIVNIILRFSCPAPSAQWGRSNKLVVGPSAVPAFISLWTVHSGRNFCLLPAEDGFELATWKQQAAWCHLHPLTPQIHSISAFPSSFVECKGSIRGKEKKKISSGREQSRCMTHSSAQNDVGWQESLRSAAVWLDPYRTLQEETASLLGLLGCPRCPTAEVFTAWSHSYLP